MYSAAAAVARYAASAPGTRPRTAPSQPGGWPRWSASVLSRADRGGSIPQASAMAKSTRPCSCSSSYHCGRNVPTSSAREKPARATLTAWDVESASMHASSHATRAAAGAAETGPKALRSHSITPDRSR